MLWLRHHARSRVHHVGGWGHSRWSHARMSRSDHVWGLLGSRRRRLLVLLTRLHARPLRRYTSHLTTIRCCPLCACVFRRFKTLCNHLGEEFADFLIGWVLRWLLLHFSVLCMGIVHELICENFARVGIFDFENLFLSDGAGWLWACSRHPRPCLPLWVLPIRKVQGRVCVLRYRSIVPRVHLGALGVHDHIVCRKRVLLDVEHCLCLRWVVRSRRPHVIGQAPSAYIVRLVALLWRSHRSTRLLLVERCPTLMHGLLWGATPVAVARLTTNVVYRTAIGLIWQ